MADVLNGSDVVRSANSLANDVYRVSQAVAKTSVTRLTKDQVFQFPVFMDGSIDDDEQYPIVKSIEKNYAQLIMIAITNNGVIDRDRYSDVNQFLRKFHNNSGIPTAMESVSLVDAIITEGFLPEKDIVSMQGNIEDRLDTSTINDMYKPYTATEAKLNRAIEDAKEQRRIDAAMEADSLFFKRPVYARDRKGNIIRDTVHGNAPKVEMDNNGNPKYEYIVGDPSDAASFNQMRSEYGEPQTARQWNDANLRDRIAAKAAERAPELADQKAEREADKADKARERELNVRGTTNGNVVKDDKFANMSPTVIHFTLANIKKDIGSWSQNLIIGVKAVARAIPQSLMVNNMVDACKDRAIFNFIKWTNHELKFFDVLFGISTYRSDARNMDNRWMKVLRKRSRRSKLPGFKLNPNTTIIITENDVHLIQEKCGVNLNDISNIRKVMDKYFLLGFGIYDTEGKMLRIIYDGEDEYTQHSMRSLMAEVKKDANLLAMNRY